MRRLCGLTAHASVCAIWPDAMGRPAALTEGARQHSICGPVGWSPPCAVWSASGGKNWPRIPMPVAILRQFTDRKAA